VIHIQQTQFVEQLNCSRVEEPVIFLERLVLFDDCADYR
jgi:hypothetical protein